MFEDELLDDMTVVVWPSVVIVVVLGLALVLLLDDEPLVVEDVPLVVEDDPLVEVDDPDVELVETLVRLVDTPVCWHWFCKACKAVPTSPLTKQLRVTQVSYELRKDWVWQRQLKSFAWQLPKFCEAQLFAQFGSCIWEDTTIEAADIKTSGLNMIVRRERDVEHLDQARHGGAE